MYTDCASFFRCFFYPDCTRELSLACSACKPCLHPVFLMPAAMPLMLQDKAGKTN